MAKKKSSLIEGTQYISFRKELFIKFTSGELYVYFDVPYSINTEFKKAESLGRYFGEKIKHDYNYQRIEI